MMFGLAMLALVLIAVFVTVGVVVLVHLSFAHRNAVPAVFTPQETMDELLMVLDLPESGEFVDLGCGDGRVMAAVLAKRPKLKVIGVENNPIVMSLARLRLGGKAKLVQGDISKVGLEKADRVFAYLGPGLMEQLEPRFEQELAPGVRVVSQQFPLPHRKPDKVVDLKGGKSHARRLYVYDY